MKILFCNIAYMNYYEGSITKDIIPMGGGKYVKENEDAHEKWNFLNVDGSCYGFVQNSGSFHIERFGKGNIHANSVDDVLIVWCASEKKNKTVIIGWYEHATLYRNYQDAICTPISGIDRCYITKANADDCYLLPLEERVFEIGRASKVGAGKGFGQENFWYAESEYAQKEIIPRVLQFIEEKRHTRINRVNRYFQLQNAASGKLSEEEMERMNQAFEEEDNETYLPLAYRFFQETNSSDTAFNIAVSLTDLHQYHHALTWYEKVIEIEGPSWDTLGKLCYLYQQIEAYDKSIKCALDLQRYPESKVPEVRDEINSILADNYHFLGETKTALSYLDTVLVQSSDKDLIAHTEEVKAAWSK